MKNVIPMKKESNFFDVSGMDWAITMTFDEKNLQNTKNTVGIDSVSIQEAEIEKRLSFMSDYTEAKSVLEKLKLI
jgi:hypothetical protein